MPKRDGTDEPPAGAPARPLLRRLRSRRVAVLGGFGGGLAIILALGATIGRGRVEADLAHRARSAANASASPVWPDITGPSAPLDIRFEGRRAVVSGTVPDATSHLLVVQAVRRTPGVRGVDDRIVVPPTTTIALEASPTTTAPGSLTVDVLRARIEEGRITLEGTIADRGAHIRLVEQLLTRHRGRLADQLVRSGPAEGQAATALVPSFGSLVNAAAGRIRSGSISLSDSTLLLLGTARSEADRDAVQRSASRLSTQWRIVNALQIPVPVPPVAQQPDAPSDRAAGSTAPAPSPAADDETAAVSPLSGPQTQLDELLSTASLERTPSGSGFTTVSGLVLDEIARVLTDAQDEGIEIGGIEVAVRAEPATPDPGGRARQIVAALQARGVSGVAWQPVGLSANARTTLDGPALAVRIRLEEPPPPTTSTSLPAPTATR